MVDCVSDAFIGDISPQGMTGRQAGKLTAAMLAIQVTNTTGVPTTPDEIIWRVNAILPRHAVSVEVDPNVGQVTTYSTVTLEDTLDRLSGVFYDTSGVPQPALRYVDPLLKVAGWADKVYQIAAALSGTGLDRVLVDALGPLAPVGEIVENIGKKLLDILQNNKAFAQLMGQIGTAAQGLAQALPILGAFLQTGFSFLNWLSSKVQWPLVFATTPAPFAPEVTSLYALASGRPASSFVDVQFNPVFNEVFLRDIDAPGFVPQRALDLGKYRSALATSPAIHNWIKKGPNSAILAASRKVEFVFGCRGYTGLQPYMFIYGDSGMRGALVAAAYLFANTSCVRNVGAWYVAPFQSNPDQCDSSGYTHQSQFFDLGRGAIIASYLCSGPGGYGGRHGLQLQTNWFAKTDAQGQVWVHPPVPLTGAPGSVQSECSKFRKWLFNGILSKSADWYKLGEEPQQPLVPQLQLSPQAQTFRARAGECCDYPAQGSGRFPQQSAVAQAGTYTSTTPTGQTQTQQVILRPQRVVRLAKPLLPAGVAGRKQTVAISPGGQLKAVAPQTPGMSTGTKVAIGVGATAAVGTGGYLLYRHLKGSRT